jgi:hypothetical protein
MHVRSCALVLGALGLAGCTAVADSGTTRGESVEQLFERHRRVFEIGRLLAKHLE